MPGLSLTVLCALLHAYFGWRPIPALVARPAPAIALATLLPVSAVLIPLAKRARRLLLAHQPVVAIAAAAAGFHLPLSGHTHGGQFRPWNLFVRLQQPFTAGLHRLADLWVYTSRGTGYWGPPKRFAAPSGIAFLRLIPDRA